MSAPPPPDAGARDRAEMAACADMFRAAPPGLVAALGIAAEEREGVLMIRVDWSAPG